MQGFKYLQPAESLKLESPGGTPRQSQSNGLSRSNSFNDPSTRTEAALRAQLIELRRELGRSQQEVEKNQNDLQQRQELLRSAAGEARREVLALRKHREESARELTDSIQRIATLEHEVRELREKLGGGVGSGSEAEGWGGGRSRQELEDAVESKERELEEVKATERVNDASKQALTSQIGELVGRLTALQNELEESQQARERLQGTADGLREEVERQKQMTEELQQRLQGATDHHEQAASKAELLENELDVMGAESTEDRLSGAARLLELTQRCEELQTELASARAGIPQANAERRESGHHASSSRVGSQSPDRQASGGLADILIPSPSRWPPGSPLRPGGVGLPARSSAWRPGDTGEGPESSLKSPQKKLLAEIVEASTYLQNLHLRLEADEQTGGEDAGAGLVEEDAHSAEEAIKKFTAALSALQATVDKQKLEEILGAHATVHVHADSSKKALRSRKNRGLIRGRLGSGVIGGLIVIPALAVIAAFLPSRR